MMIRHCFVREENDGLILRQDLAPRWLGAGTPFEFGPAPTAFGPMTIRVSVEAAHHAVHVSWDAAWRDRQPPIDIRLPGYPAMRVVDD